MTFSKPDLTQHAPRSPRVRLGGYVILPRILDKCRAVLAGKQGEYKFACPLDQRWFDFVGIKPDAFKKKVASGKSDSEILAWVRSSAKLKRTEAEIAAWCAIEEARVPSNPDSREYLNNLHKQVAPKRDDIATWFDALDLDDYASYGGKV